MSQVRILSPRPTGRDAADLHFLGFPPIRLSWTSTSCSPHKREICRAIRMVNGARRRDTRCTGGEGGDSHTGFLLLVCTARQPGAWLRRRAESGAEPVHQIGCHRIFSGNLVGDRSSTRAATRGERADHGRNLHREHIQRLSIDSPKPELFIDILRMDLWVFRHLCRARFPFPVVRGTDSTWCRAGQRRRSAGLSESIWNRRRRHHHLRDRRSGAPRTGDMGVDDPRFRRARKRDPPEGFSSQRQERIAIQAGFPPTVRPSRKNDGAAGAKRAVSSSRE